LKCEKLVSQSFAFLKFSVLYHYLKLVQSFKNPPAAIKLVMEAICVCLDIKPAKVVDPSGSGKKIDDYWEPSKKILADSNFVQGLREYDKDNIKPKVIAEIRKTYTSNLDFTPANAAKASSAAEVGGCTSRIVCLTCQACIAG
jgi:dynein heavy chain